MQRLPAIEFLKKAQQLPVIDVRSPKEFAHGHIPGAYSLPLFDDLERAEVGILYHKSGREEAVKKGLEIVGPKMRAYVDEALKLATNGELLVYCWRGGMRSESMAWLFETSGIRAFVLEKGYKGFRAHIRELFGNDQPIMVIGGRTGSGKTSLLQAIAHAGGQTIDLEDLANHKGSVFGNLGLPEQPTTEHFQNLLGIAWSRLEQQKPVFLEDESLNIGRACLPMNLYEKMQQATLLFVDMPLESRMRRLHREYAHFSPQELTALIEKITKRLGGQNARLAIQAIEEGRLNEAIGIALVYYDKAYGFDVGQREKGKIIPFKVDDENVEILADDMINTVHKIYQDEKLTRLP